MFFFSPPKGAQVQVPTPRPKYAHVLRRTVCHCLSTYLSKRCQTVAELCVLIACACCYLFHVKTCLKKKCCEIGPGTVICFRSGVS